MSDAASTAPSIVHDAASLETIPTSAAHEPHGTIPNTPLVASTISFVLGSVFTAGALIFLLDGSSKWWWATPQLGFFVAAWAAFHEGEFLVTAGWNRPKCSVDCKRPVSSRLS